MTAHLRLRQFITEQMRMSHLYQPVMLKEILTRGGQATVEDIAKALLSHDQSQIEYYALRTKGMVGNVLTKHGITEPLKAGRNVTGYRIPEASGLTDAERSELLALCDQKIAEYIDRRGARIWSHRTTSSGYVPGSLRYEVLKRAKFRCELCGISAEEKTLEVDHILPRNNGGTDNPSNLQALCYSCNAMKRDRDSSDFRGIAESYHHREADCIFCQLEPDRIVAENELCFAIRDAFPVTPLHTLIIPKRHVADYFDVYQPELNAIQSLLQEQRATIVECDECVAGFNVGINSGAAAGQTVFHCHVHLIPRREGDVEQPRGGVRGVVPGKASY